MTERDKKYLTWQDVKNRLQWDWPHGAIKVYGVPRGGAIIALLLADVCGTSLAYTPEEADVLVDDITDSGKTEKRFTTMYKKPFWSAYKSDGQTWLVFPWEKKDEGVEDNIIRILEWFNCPVDSQNVTNLSQHIKSWVGAK